MNVAAVQRAWVLPRRFQASLGRATRRQVRFTLLLGALSFGLFREVVQPHAWRRTVRAEFQRLLRQSVGGGLSTVLVTAALVGVALVHQTLYWLNQVGQGNLIGPMLVNGLVRGIGPVLVGLILLGRIGMPMVAQLAGARTGGQVHAMEALGLDPFLLLLLPRSFALAIASFTLIVIFIAVALLTGFIVDTLLQSSTMTFGAFLGQMEKAMVLTDVVIFPIKASGIGHLIALTAGITALEGHQRAGAANLLPQAFVRGILVILTFNVALTLLT
jgi:phospholipid/cholesterol/gamma-HCH transport system permease protein